jgi:hypothetical protein
VVLGPMEHILWEVVAQDKPTDIEAVSTDLVALLWSAVRAPCRNAYLDNPFGTEPCQADDT